MRKANQILSESGFERLERQVAGLACSSEVETVYRELCGADYSPAGASWRPGDPPDMPIVILLNKEEPEVVAQYEAKLDDLERRGLLRHVKVICISINCSPAPGVTSKRDGARHLTNATPRSMGPGHYHTEENP